MGNLWDYDGTVIKNRTDHVIQLVPYRADGVLVTDTDNPDVEQHEYRLINNDHIGDADFFIVVAMMKGGTPPPHIGVQTGIAGHESGGSISIGFEGASLTVGGEDSETKTIPYSSSMAAGIVPLRKNRDRDRYESNANFQTVEVDVMAVIQQGRSVTVDGREPDLTGIKIWEIQYVGERDLKMEEREGRASVGW
jgi:hypothetical protein